MKCQLAVFFLVAIAALAMTQADDKQDAIVHLMEVVETCRNEVGATSDDMEELVQKKPPTNMAAKCMHACIMKNYKMWEVNGKFPKSIFMDHVKVFTHGDADQMKIAEAIVDDCSKLAVPDNDCEKAGLYAKCFMEHAMAQGFKDPIPT